MQLSNCYKKFETGRIYAVVVNQKMTCFLFFCLGPTGYGVIKGSAQYKRGQSSFFFKEQFKLS